MSSTPTNQPPPARRAWAWIAAVIVGLAAAIPFWPAVQGGFSNYDDHGFLLEVDQWRGLGPGNLAWMFSTFHLGHYQPLTYISYAIDHALFGLEPAAYHRTNILLHAASAVLVMLLTRRVLTLVDAGGAARAQVAGTRPGAGHTLIAAGAAIVWGLHPLRVESVAWITERRDVLSCLLLLSATLAYLQHASSGARPGRGRWYAITLVLLALSLLAKAWGLTFFVVALLLDIRPLRRLPPTPLTWLREPSARAVVLEKTPMLVLGLIAAGFAAGAQSESAVRTLAQWGPLERLLQAAYGLVFYIDRTLAPRNLAVLYELPARLDTSEPRWLVAAVLVLAAAAAMLVMWRRRTGLVVAVACYVVIVSPVLGLFQSGVQLVADRYAHLATIPLFMLAGAGTAMLLRRRGSRAIARGLAAVWLAITVALGVMTWRQSTLWQSDERLWTSAIARGADGPITRNYYANHLESQNRLADAEREYRESLRLNPGFGDSAFGLASVLNKQGRFAEAAEAFTKAATIQANPAPALQMLGIISISRLNKPREAIAAFRAAVEVTEARGNPERTGRPYLLLAAALGQSGDEATAVPLLKKAAEFADSRGEAEGHLRSLGVIR
jgi:tetratricopeptide (TPR) repeat protein